MLRAMAPIYSKNAILVGVVDYFCLVCEAHLHSDIDTIAHIIQPVHLKHLKAIINVEEFKADGIKKIKNKYFCELCNKLLNVLARVRLHITEQSHIDNKNISFLKRVGDYIIAYEKVLICNRSWNGLNENSCALCNIEYESFKLFVPVITPVIMPVTEEHSNAVGRQKYALVFSWMSPAKKINCCSSCN
ncbi:jg9927 [Pararge aegeria aegeria]|uniref:Jg9927 protein n=1 Tax=Pararge aegeria aegeria TaxID=348720 RepID=A0A8S4QW77_9NEOP|nr:jg9927 [Pararge aegeria aegeria]